MGRIWPWYVAPALGERPTSAPRYKAARFAATALLSLSALGLAACGGETPAQSDNEPKGEFEVEVTEAEFPTAQRLAQTSDLVLGVKNTGEETVPELAFTIRTDGEVTTANSAQTSAGSFSVNVDDPSLANPTRPVWILENKYPREAGTPAPAGVSGGTRAQTNTFGFGSLEPGEERKIVWRVTAVSPGTYDLGYVVSAGLDGNARAVTADGGEVKGEFVVTITDKPPKAYVDDAGNVITEGDEQLEGE